MNFEQDIKIDHDSLDVEWLEQPELMLRYGRYQASCALELDKAKERLDVVRAELDKKIRANPEAYEIAKVTETVVSNTIITQDEYMEAQSQALSAKFEFDIARAAVNAIHGRKDALENLVRLHGMQYFAGPNMPRNLNQEVLRKKQQENVDSGVGQKLRRRKNNHSQLKPHQNGKNKKEKQIQR